MKTLKGKVVHRLDLVDLHEDEISISKKCEQPRKRQRSAKTNDESRMAKDTVKVATAAARFHRASGLVFIPFDHSQYPEFILSLPQHLQKLACHAAINDEDVWIDRYVTFPMTNANDDGPPEDHHIESSFALLEVHHMKLVEKNTHQNNTSMSEDDDDDVCYYLTLAQFRQKEGREFTELNTVKSTQYHQIVATVDAISPIIAMDPSKPFSLIELYDCESEEDSCVLILKGSKELTCHSGIFPGDTIKFKGLRRKPWRVPQTFRCNKAVSHLSGRAPLYVFVADGLHCISLDVFRCTVPSSLPATPIPLVSIHGTVKHVETTTVKRKGGRSRTIQWLEISPITTTTTTTTTNLTTFKLYLAQYPLSAALLLSLRNGAEVCAVNIHSIGRTFQPNSSVSFECFGACLRSTISLVKHALLDNSPSCHDIGVGCSCDEEEDSSFLYTQPEYGVPFYDSTTTPTTTTTASPVLSIHDFVPYQFCKTMQSNDQDIIIMYRHTVEDFHHKHFSKNETTVPRVDIILEGLISEIDKLLRSTATNSPREQHCRGGGGGGLSAKKPFESEVPATTSRKSKKKKKKKRAIARDPYAEFFDHAAGGDDDNDDDDDDEPVSNPVFEMKGCTMSRKECREYQPRPHLVGLYHIRSVGLELLSDRIAAREASGDIEISMGWNSSIHLTDKDLLEEMGKRQDTSSEDCTTLLFSGGVVRERKPNTTVPVSLLDKNCCIPVGFSREIEDFASDFVFGRVIGAVMGCICVASLSDETNEEQSQDDGQPPRNFPTQCEATSIPLSNSLAGSGSLILVGRKLFVTSIYVCFEQPVAMRSLGEVNRGISVSEERSAARLGLTIRDCLESPWGLSKSGESDRIKGLLLRTRFVYPKIQSNNTLCTGFVLTLSNVPYEKVGGTSEASCLQSLEVKLSIPICTGKIEDLQQAIARLSPDLSLSDPQMALAIWWSTLADSGMASPLLLGGWDDLVEGSWADDVTIHISFPVSTMSTVRGGFLRVDCRLDQIEATYTKARSDCTIPHSAQTVKERPKTFDFVNSGKALVAGTVCQRPKRRNVFGEGSHRRVGERVDSSSTDVPIRTLAFLFHRLCRSLHYQDPALLSPELVVQISGASFLGISFCQVACICTRCYKRLLSKQSARNKEVVDKKDHNDIGESTAGTEPSFWHLPNPDRPMLAVDAMSSIINNNNNNNNNNNQSAAAEVLSEPRHSMRCPSGCPSECFGLKWECSGTLDDGTGQARLFAERDVALTLLGMDARTIHLIEEGVWHSDTASLCFNSPIPPRRKLQEQVKSALFRGKRIGQDPLKYLPPASRAEYLLQYYCRNWRRRQRLDYFIRCKPLPDGIQHLKHTMIEGYIPERENGSLCTADVATYALPPLKLQLVDCGVPTEAGTMTIYAKNLKSEPKGGTVLALGAGFPNSPL